MPNVREKKRVTPYALLLAGFDYSNAAEDEFNDWYDTEHIPERLGVQGFINAQRWVSENGSKIALATYDLESLSVLQDPAYTTRKGAARTPWSKRIGRKAQLTCRLVGEQLVPGQKAAPDGAGGLLMFAANVKPEAEAEFNAWYNEEHLPALSAVPGCLCARRFKTTEGAPAYVALYHVSDPAVIRSDAWQAAVNTPWTMRIRPQMSDEMRLLLRSYSRKN